MAVHNEIRFEEELAEYLEAHGWLYSRNDTGYDVARALYPPDVFAWLEATQPETWARAVPASAPPAAQEQTKQQLLDRLVKTLDKPFDGPSGTQGGTLSVLRRGFKDVPLTFSMAQFQPADDLNPKTNADHAAMRLRVMRQVHYSAANRNSIDLVLFVNGLPVATLELKTDFTQSVQDAVAQYRRDRHPKGEPLLSFGHRALVHFAVSNTEVRMTTHLRGEQTRFLPFNRGNVGRAGNPVNPAGSATAYLWEQVLQRDAWLDILGRFLHLQVDTTTNPVTGAVEKSETLLFPRFHQWESVTKLIAAAREEGPGHRYLIQHSAGSGKTNSIAWTAHQLSTLHRPSGEKVFDSVIVITDRTVLDTQLREAIQQIDAKSGVVVAIDEKGAGSKSSRLSEALIGGAQIIVVTIQTFPFALATIRDSGALAGKSFAIIADEAHSSQTGTTSAQVKLALSPDELADVNDGGEIDVEAVLAAEMAGRANAANLSFFAYTATPKAKTMELFGRRPTPSEPPVPFHVYTMQQAIEEGFILDVLRNYTPYKLAFKLAHDGREYDSEAPMVERSRAVSELMNWVKLHDFNVTQKAALIVEHFRENVAWRLGGKGKAMVVTSSRRQAVRYKLAFDRYIAERGYGAKLQALVAFSGEVSDPDLSPDPFTETSMNPGLRGRTLPKAFASDEFQILLVANKYQTGFDQPLLTAMYVDKKLSGVTAVQTLSRLNRTATGKDTTFVLDFVNDPGEIVESFEPYFRDARLSDVSDPNVVVDTKDKLDASGLYTADEVDAAARALVRHDAAGRGGRGNNALDAAVSPARQRFNVRWNDAVEARDGEARDRLELFRSDLTAFVNAYDFLSQIRNFEDPEIEKFAIYARALARVIREDTRHLPIDLTGVELVRFSINEGATQQLGLTGEGELDPTTAVGSGTVKDPKLVAIQDAIDALNQLWDDASITESDTEGFVRQVVRKAGEDDRIRAQAAANTEEQFLGSPDLKPAVVTALLTASDNFATMSGETLDSQQKLDMLIRLVGRLVHQDEHSAV